MKNIFRGVIAQSPSLFVLVMFPSIVFAQSTKDTIYLDYRWSICERPAASYYRVCAIQTGQYVYYKGPFEDYYMNGQLEMTGSYNDKGLKEGAFISYYNDGTIKSEGFFEDDIYKGVWKFYNPHGELVLKLNCHNESDFTPLFIMNKQGDTLLKDANGEFILEREDFPGIFAASSFCSMQGNIAMGKKNGKIRYYSCGAPPVVEYTETFNNGKLKSSSYDDLGGYIKTSQGQLQLHSEKLSRTDEFFHENPLFGKGDNGNKRALDFVVRKNISGIPSQAKVFNDNYQDIFNVIGYALNGVISNGNNAVYYADFNDDDRSIFNRVVIYGNNNKAEPIPLNCLVTVAIDSSGYVANSIFRGSLQRNAIDVINYYLGNLYGLKPFEENGIKRNKDIHIRLYNHSDTSLVDSVQRVDFMYVLENADRKELPAFPLIVDIEAKFPGGPAAWQRYLQLRLRSDVPVDHRAPNGIYTVKLSFMVDKEGQVSDITVLNDPGYGTADEAVRVIKQGPAWTPAVKDGRNIAYRQKQSITFVVAGG